ncbi:DNA-binding protein [Methylobacterium oryzihabitans]|uniref:DNA-binding protein n=1 Tax=Methylobacterium oryzihabitans TaxID=2499852 RepID=A0A3S2V490_9HYPH|nr:DNA-binding protein [Methylobacterium oryzihabitans]
MRSPSCMARGRIPGRARMASICPPGPEGVALRTFAEACAELRMSAKTLRGYMRNGAIRHIAYGHGLHRRRRLFHPDDIAAFLDSQRSRDVACPSIGPRKPASSRRKSTSTTSGAVVVGFMARRDAARNGTPNG